MSGAYIHRYTHWWDHGLHIQSGVNLPMLWAQLVFSEQTDHCASCSLVAFGTGVGANGFP